MQQETTIHFQTTDDLIDSLRALVQDTEFALMLCLQTPLAKSQTFADYLVHTKCSWFFACGEKPTLMEHIIDQADSELMMSDQQYAQHFGRDVLLTIANDDSQNECVEEAKLMLGDDFRLATAIQAKEPAKRPSG